MIIKNLLGRNEATKELLNYYDAIFFINMDSSTDRRSHIEEFLQLADIPVHRIQAVTPDDSVAMQIKYNAESRDISGLPWRIDQVNDKTRLIEACCSRSHALALSTAFGMGYRHVLILEDDAKIIDSDIWLNQFLEIRKTIPDDAFMTYLCYMIFRSNPGTYLLEKGYSIDLIAHRDYVARSHGGLMSTCAYSVNFDNISATALTTMINELDRGSIADLYYSMGIQTKHPVYFTHVRPFMPEESFESTIGEAGVYDAIAEAYEDNAFHKELVFGRQPYENFYPKRNRHSPVEYALFKNYYGMWRKELLKCKDLESSIQQAKLDIEADDVEEAFVVEFQAGSNKATKFKIKTK